MTQNRRGFVTVALSTWCLTAGVLSAPAFAVPQAGAGAVLVGAASSVSRPAASVRPGRIQVRITLNGDLLGRKPQITVIGVGGRARGVTRKVRARIFTVIKGLPPGRYRISAPKIVIRGRSIAARVTPARVRLTRSRGAAVLVRYRMPNVEDGFQGHEHSPVAVDTPTRFVSVAAGDLHTCGIDTAGKAWCWGDDSKGALGDGRDDQTAEYSPVAVTGKHRFTTLTAGGMYTCGIDTDALAWCWGSDGNGKLGDGDDGQAREFGPVAVAGGHRFRSLSAAQMHTCGIDTSGTAWCWGWDIGGAAGDGDDGQGNAYVPTRVASDATFTTIAAGNEHTCGLDTQGMPWCWGADYAGAVGDGPDDQGNEYSPVAVAGGHSFVSLTAGLRHTCGIDSGGTAWCWGADWEQQLGDGGDLAPGSQAVPVAVAGEHAWTFLTAGDNHTCGVDTGGKAWCWGAAGSGRLGDGGGHPVGGYQPPQSSPVAVAGVLAWSDLAAGYEHTCGIDTAGEAWCWGADGYGQVGDGDEYVPL